MSKKLLMNNYSENGLMPVTDGLIGWYDARYRDDDDTYLIDKSNNRNNIPCKSSSCVFYDKYIDVRNNSSYSDTIDYSSYINREFTISYYIDTTNSQGNQLKCMAGNYRNTLGWWIKPDTNMSNIWYQGVKYIDDYDNIKIFPRGKIMVTIVWNSIKVGIYVNGILFISKSINNINVSNLQLSLFGDKQYFNTINYKFYSSYVYNRVLTEEEIQQNYEYEQSIERG